MEEKNSDFVLEEKVSNFECNRAFARELVQKLEGHSKFIFALMAIFSNLENEITLLANFAL
jgi:hypothetical protein